MSASGVSKGLAGRAPLAALAGFSLLSALWAGLVRLGWNLPPLPLPVVANHGALMVSGFLGTLISLERVVALSYVDGRRRPFFLAPLLAGLGALALIAGLPPVIGRVLLVLGALVLVLMFGYIYRLHPDAAHATMGIGALLWLAGNSLWLYGLPVHRAVPWWAGFLILTIAGERLELARVLLLGQRARQLFSAASGFFLAGLWLSLPAFELGVRLSGLGLLGLGLWLLRFDIARRTIRQRGLTRFMAACLLPGYVWLATTGLLWMVFGGGYTSGPIYDAMLHSLFLGFVFSMIFGHAPIILPAVLRIAVPFHPFFYAHLALLHLSLVLRLIGDLAAIPSLRLWGGLFNVIALLQFLIVTGYTARRATARMRIAAG